MSENTETTDGTTGEGDVQDVTDGQVETTTDATEQTTDSGTSNDSDPLAAYSDADLYKAMVARTKDDSLREYADRFGNFNDITKGALDLRKKVSQPLNVPADDAPDDDKDTYREAVKAGKTADDYAPQLPQDLELDDKAKDLLGKMQDAAHAAYVPVPTFHRLVAEYLENAGPPSDEEITADTSAQAQASLEALKGEFHNLDGALEAGKRMRDKTGGPELAELLDMPVMTKEGKWIKLGNEKAMVRMMATLGERMGEDGIIGTMNVDEAKTLQEQADKLMADNPPGTPGYAKVAPQIEALYQKMHGTAG